MPSDTKSGETDDTLTHRDAVPIKRRIKRLALRVLRPIGAPFLNRLQFRMQYAAEQAVVRAGASQQQQTEASLQRIQAIQSNLLSGFDAIMSRLDTLSARLDSPPTRLDSLPWPLESVAFRIDMMQLGLDAVRSDQAVIAQQAQDQLAALLARDNPEVALTQMQTLLGILVSRLDYTRERNAIPLGSEILLRVPDGFLLVPAEDPLLLSCLWDAAGRLEPGTIKVLTALVKPGDHVVDVGAHIGLTVLPVARCVGPNGRVIAVEPGSRTAALLQQNLALNGLTDRVILHAFAAGEAPGVAQLNIGQVLGHSSLISLPEAHHTEEVQIRPIDALVEPGERIRLVKIDTEGFEPQVWKGMQRVIRDNQELAVLVEFGPSHLQRAGISPQLWLHEFLAPGFTAYEVNETDGTIAPLRPLTDLAAVASLNLLLLRQPPSHVPDLQFA
ncbi:FkbM family methyltransferase [Belnapia moabensis]|uniref:FkbM family methyltransferase n=1 Tax=Belnapia moabensis TaxID=365533 RepID=UPI000A0256A6|nr:FkbM family methyltransferase [Belnapia moabensis]